MKQLWFLFCWLALFCGVGSASPEWQRDERCLLTNFNNMYNPCVVETSGEYRFKMWFFGWAIAITNPDVPGCDAIYHARSRDLLTWEVYSEGGTWDTTMNPEKWVPVLHASTRWYDAWHTGESYHCFSDAHGYPIEPGESPWRSRQLREAVSSDGLVWKKLEFIPPDEDADACRVPQTLITRIDGQEWLYLFYATQIGTRKNDGQYHYQYDRIRAMRRLINTKAQQP